jgi:peptide/nickel transport system substrate-binding protein
MSHRIHRGMLPAALATTMLAMTASASATTLTVGLSAEPTSVDPHYHNLGPNNALAKHIFGTLVEQDAQQLLGPGLAESWEALDDTTWEIKLREGVAFSNGDPFTARDVVYTVCRIPHVPDAPSPFTLYTSSIAGMEIVDDHTLHISTDGPAPLLPNHLSTFNIISASVSGAEEEVTFDVEGCDGLGETPTSDLFNDPDFAIGTGPYLLGSYVRGDRIVLQRNPDYWGEEPAWDEIVLRPITNPGARVAALLAGCQEATPVFFDERLGARRILLRIRLDVLNVDLCNHVDRRIRLGAEPFDGHGSESEPGDDGKRHCVESFHSSSSSVGLRVTGVDASPSSGTRLHRSPV